MNFICNGRTYTEGYNGETKLYPKDNVYLEIDKCMCGSGYSYTETCSDNEWGITDNSGTTIDEILDWWSDYTGDDNHIDDSDYGRIRLMINSKAIAETPYSKEQ